MADIGSSTTARGEASRWFVNGHVTPTDDPATIDTFFSAALLDNPSSNYFVSFFLSNVDTQFKPHSPSFHTISL